MPKITFTVPVDFSDSMRLDQYISLQPKGMNRSKLKATAQEILLNGKNAKLSAKVKAKDVIDIFWEENIPDNIEPENIPLQIVYEDENVTVVNKKQGMVTHPAAGNWSGTLVNALLYHWGREAVPQLKEGGENQILQKRRPGIVHRLDKDTSGLIITAKNRDTEEWLCSQFHDRHVQKEYICIVCGRPPASAGDVRTQIIRDPKQRQRFKAVTNTQEGKASRSIYHVISSYGPYSLIRVRIKTGRTHQIRVHMKYLGCPILGDKIYGKTDPLFPQATLMLHSRQMILKTGPQEKYRIFRAPVPKRFVDTIATLRTKYKREEWPWVSNKKKLK
ncbi:MAG: RluA family pseudouridine synthase [Treponema sp.]|nr:RluA family pseudouridine synthase [Treponema sp.]